MKIFILVNSLEMGGAERQACNLARGLYDRGNLVVVFTLKGGGEQQQSLMDYGVIVENLDHRGFLNLPATISTLVSIVRRESPAVFYSMLPGPNIISALARPWWGSTPLVWGVRSGALRFQDFPTREYIQFRLGAILARVPERIIFNSYEAQDFYLSQGYAPQGTTVIHNGIDTDYFKPDEEGRWRVRAEWGVKVDEPLFGMVARIDPLKDHFTFIKAAKVILQRFPNSKFAIIGEGPASRKELINLEIAKQGMNKSFIWAGRRSDLPAVYSALDMHILSSFQGEGFPNVVAEAMSCGVPSVTFDVGDAARILISRDFLVTNRSPEGLAYTAIEGLIKSQNFDLARAMRSRVVGRYSIGRLAEETHIDFAGLAAQIGDAHVF
jgi:glycosyltransferase involved in cell wall biosynthesis